MILVITINKEKAEDQEERPYHIFEEPHPGRTIHIYFSDIIGQAKEYVDLSHRIKTAGEHDVIYMYLNTPGGFLDAGMQILLSMRVSKAHIISVLEGEVCSLGSLLFLSADEFIVHDNTILMIHNHTGGQWGKGHEYMAKAGAVSTWFGNLAKKIYKNFLTPKEIKEMLDGKDFWFQSDEVKKRLEKMVTAANKESKPTTRRTRTKSETNRSSKAGQRAKPEEKK